MTSIQSAKKELYILSFYVILFFSRFFTSFNLILRRLFEREMQFLPFTVRFADHRICILLGSTLDQIHAFTRTTSCFINIKMRDRNEFYPIQSPIKIIENDSQNDSGYFSILDRILFLFFIGDLF